MPLCLNKSPGSKITLWLSSDADKPRKQRPVFYTRVLTCREWQKVVRISDGFRRKKSGAKAIKQILESLEGIVTGWDNISRNGQKIKFDIKFLDEILTIGELMELMILVIGQQDSEEIKPAKPGRKTKAKK